MDGGRVLHRHYYQRAPNLGIPSNSTILTFLFLRRINQLILGTSIIPLLCSFQGSQLNVFILSRTLTHLLVQV